MQTPIKAAGLCWYTRQNYARVLAVMADAEKLPRSYDKWRKEAEAAEQRFRAQGWIVHRIDCDADAFLAWCTARNVDADAKARIAFANEAAARKYGHPR